MAKVSTSINCQLPSRLPLSDVSRLQLCNDSIQAAITVPIYIMLRRFISYLLLTNLSLLSLSVHRCYCLLSHHHPDRCGLYRPTACIHFYRFFQASCNQLRPRDYNLLYIRIRQIQVPNLSAMSSAHDNVNVPAVHRWCRNAMPQNGCSLIYRLPSLLYTGDR